MDKEHINEDAKYKLWLGRIRNIRASKIKLMVDYFGSPEEAYNAPLSALEQMIIVSNSMEAGFTRRDLDYIMMGKDMDIISRDFDYLNRHGVKIVTMLDTSYPDKLQNIYDPPFLFYYKGRPLPNDKKIISIVGARDCSIYGREMAEYLAGALAKEDIIIISGLARGIDTYAHRGALSQEGVTYGIMGCGIDICYPVENIKLYMDMQINGGIISEYGPGRKPLAYHFPMRNRIISALSDGILVIEAREKSGSLITVDIGLDQGKNIYAVPGRITDKLSEGCNNLLKMGAKLVSTPMDILEDLLEYLPIQETNQLELSNILPKDEQTIYEQISLYPKHIDELLEKTGFDIGKLMEYLLSLEFKSMISQPMKNYYTRKGYTRKKKYK